MRKAQAALRRRREELVCVDEGCGAGDLLEDAIEVFDDCGWSTELAGAKTEGHGERGHEESGGDAFAGDVGDDDVDDVV